MTGSKANVKLARNWGPGNRGARRRWRGWSNKAGMPGARRWRVSELREKARIVSERNAY